MDAVTAALAGLPLPRDGEALHHAQMLRMLGSIADIGWGARLSVQVAAC